MKKNIIKVAAVGVAAAFGLTACGTAAGYGDSGSGAIDWQEVLADSWEEMGDLGIQEMTCEAWNYDNDWFLDNSEDVVEGSGFEDLLPPRSEVSKFYNSVC